MSTTTPPTTVNDSNRPINLLSLDAGGPRGVSQLLILKNVMERLSKEENGDVQGTVKRPCEVFDMIGGVGTGGLIAILLVAFKMTAKDALNEFSNFAVEVFNDVLPDPKKQTEKLTRTIHGIFEKHGIPKDAKLVLPHQNTPTCKLTVPVMYKNHVGTPCVLRSYTPNHEPAVDISIFEAMLATCSTPPIFTSTTISKDFATFEYIGGDLGLSNPTREIIAEARRAFGDETTVSCLLSIGCGHPGVNAAPDVSSGAAWTNFLERVAMDSEKTVQEIGAHMSQLTLYHRLCVNRGLEGNQVQNGKDPSLTTAHTTSYLTDQDVVEHVDRCTDAIKHGDGFVTLEQIMHCSGAKVLLPPLPPLATNYVERRLPMEFIEKVLFEDDGRVRPGSKIVVVTGIGGCGKTQLTRRFIEKYKDIFVSTFFIDGSSPDTIRRDIVRYVRALGGPHSQKSFDESMVFLSQVVNGERLFVIDNVDDSTLGLSPFLPRWQNGVVIVTSRNHSRGQLSACGHLQLDVMTVGESAELLVRGSGQQWPPTEADRMLAISVAEELGCHPIALVQAISYMYSTGCAPVDYITLLHGNRERLLRDHPATSQVDMRYKTAFAAFDASYSILPPRAQNLWHILSFFRPQNFPVKLISLAGENGFSTDQPFLPRGEEFELGKECLTEIFCNSGQWDPLELQSMLASHSLITLTSVENIALLQMHPLVHEWGRLRISEGDRPRFEAAAVRLLCCGASKDNYTMMQYLSGHVEGFSSSWNRLHGNDAASLAFIAFILSESGMYEKSATLDGITHEIVKRALGPDHPATITGVANLAVAYGQMGRDAEAEELETEVLQRRKRLQGVNHPNTIQASASLAATYHELGRYAEAEELKTEVLRRRKQLLGVDHPDTIKASAELAVTYHSLGRYAEAGEMYKEVLRQREWLLGKGHPKTIKASSDLAGTYFALGRYAGAGVLYTQVLEKRTTLLGEQHPATIKSMLYLAHAYNATQRQSEASSLAKKALQLALETQGDGHPLSKRISAFLASLTDEELARVTRSGRYVPYKKRTPRKK